MGAGGRPAGVPHDHAGVGEAHRVARRHAEARLEAAARFERGNRDGRHLRPDEGRRWRSEEHTSELQSHHDLVCRLLLEKKKKKKKKTKKKTEKKITKKIK